MKPKSPKNVSTPLPEDRDDELTESEVERTTPLAKMMADKTRQKSMEEAVPRVKVRVRPPGKVWRTMSGGHRG